MGLRGAALALVIVVAAAGAAPGCSCGGPPKPYQAQPPAPPRDPAALDQFLAASFPTTDGGLPLISSTNATAEPGVVVHLVYDRTLDDPIVRRGQCLERVAACYRANPDGPMAGCVDYIPLCADDTGGRGCCPPACAAAFRAALAAGLAEDAAVDQSFLKGDCVAGYREQLRAVGVQP